jgi:Na+/proline symporter
MSLADWLVLLGTLVLIAAYGVWKTRRQTDMQSYLRGNDMGWLGVGLSVMATQASAITFISTPGLAFESGMGFVQNYLGLPLALVVVCAVFIPVFYRSNVFTAYEFLERRFGLRLRLFTAFLFLIQRGLAAGITIYAPAIILSAALGWHLNTTILLVGTLVILYTVSGGTRAVSITQKWQMTIILLGMGVAFGILWYKLPIGVGIGDALHLAGLSGRMQIIDFSFDVEKRYTFWSGIAGGFFLALSYFGTDQSQVQRYLAAKDVTQSRMGLVFNALLKIPMQFFILLTGVLVFSFYQFNKHPLLFNPTVVNAAANSKYATSFKENNQQHEALWEKKKIAAEKYLEARQSQMPETEFWAEEYRRLEAKSGNLRREAQLKATEAERSGRARDSDFVFLTFILNELPTGLIGLLLAVIISAAMSSTSGEINALATTTVIDFYRRLYRPVIPIKEEVSVSRWFTLLWGVLAILFALFAGLVENLIEAVNILGSVFYGTILGIFTTAFFAKFCKEKAVLAAAIIAQLTVLSLFVFFNEEIGYLWFNFIGCVLVMALSFIFQAVANHSK